jgi:hypothetical protein
MKNKKQVVDCIDRKHKTSDIPWVSHTSTKSTFFSHEQIVNGTGATSTFLKIIEKS